MEDIDYRFLDYILYDIILYILNYYLMIDITLMAKAPQANCRIYNKGNKASVKNKVLRFKFYYHFQYCCYFI